METNSIYPPLESVTQPAIATSQAAFYLNRQPQTLRAWACLDSGPLHPVRINRRLAWKTSDIRNLVNGGKQV